MAENDTATTRAMQKRKTGLIALVSPRLARLEVVLDHQPARVSHAGPVSRGVGDVPLEAVLLVPRVPEDDVLDPYELEDRVDPLHLHVDLDVGDRPDGELPALGVVAGVEVNVGGVRSNYCAPGHPHLVVLGDVDGLASLDEVRVVPLPQVVSLEVAQADVLLLEEADLPLR